MGLEMGSMDRFSKKFYLEKNLNILIVLILNHYNFLAIEQVFSRKCSNKCDDLRWNDMGQGNEECIQQNHFVSYRGPFRNGRI